MHSMPKTGYFAASALPIMRAKVTERPQQLPVDMFARSTIPNRRP